MTWPRPSHFSEEAMTDRLVMDHQFDQHIYYIRECPLCEQQAADCLDDTDEPEDA